VKAMKKLALTVATAVAWFLPAHLVILALLVFFWGTAMVSTTNTAKARLTEQRVNGVIVQQGITNTNVTTAQNAANSAQSTASSAQSTANSANSTANNAKTTADNAMPISGGTFTGPVTCGNLAVTGTFYGSGGPGGPLHVDAATTVDSLDISGGAFFLSGTGITRQSSPGTISGTGTLSSLTNCCNAIIGQLRSTGWFA
jgi:hypothetical protein